MFGYLASMMFIKWIMFSAKSDDLALTPGCAPSILIMFINMVLFKSSETLEGCKELMFEGQEALQIVFLVLAVLCIPWLLFGKPLYILYKQRTNQRSELLVYGMEQEHEEQHQDDPDELEPASEIFILQAIHTVEFILSTISHTASYLRLWALSLAHAELSEIAWTKLIRLGVLIGGLIGGFGSVIIFAMFSAWATVTVSILVVMEGLSAFLHTLRLHWVEFMSKFYDGQGYAFTPYSFKAILECDDDV